VFINLRLRADPLERAKHYFCRNLTVSEFERIFNYGFVGGENLYVICVKLRHF
jgi:hypothetical protein